VPISTNKVKVVEEFWRTAWEYKPYQNVILTTRILPQNQEVPESLLQDAIDLEECAAIVIAVDDGKINL